MIRQRCEYCTYEWSGTGPCPYCADQCPPGLYGSWWDAFRVGGWAIAINALVVIAVLLGYAVIARGQDPCPTLTQRVEYYTLDDGTRVPFSGDYMVRHEYRQQSRPIRSAVRQTVRQQPQQQANRPEVRQAPFCRSIPTINARVAGRVNTSLTVGSQAANMSIGARVVGSLGDTKP